MSGQHVNKGNNRNNNNHVRQPPRFRGEKKKRYDALIDLKERLEKQVKNISEGYLVDHHEAGEDLADVGTDNFSRDTELQIMSSEERTLILVQEAVERLIEGTYGECIDCGGEIGKGRLDAIPYAKLCISCKEVREENEGVAPREEVAEEIVE